VRSDPIRDAARAVRAGELIVLPTDTVYGLGGRPDVREATARVFEAKRRPRGLELPVLCPTQIQAHDIASFDDRADALARGCWPGALTLVLRRTDASRGWELGGDPETVGVRIPSHPLATAVLALTGPMAVTSANLSGDPPLNTCDELLATFQDRVAVYLCADEPLQGRASTVLDLAHGPARVLRDGDIDRATISRMMPSGSPLLDSRPSS
jgi:L-threonylcarbamoyladenylate synthase